MAQITVNSEKLTAAEKSPILHDSYLRAVALVSFEAIRHEQAKLAAMRASMPVLSIARNAAGEVASHDKKKPQSKNEKLYLLTG